MADIFLSHSSADNEAADRIKAWLERDRESWSVFLDKHSHDGILAGQRWQDRLRGELQSCRLVLAIITPAWLASRWCFTEAVSATFRGKDFVGVLPADLPAEALDAAPPIVHERQRQLLDLVTGAGWQELLHALDRSGLDPSHWFPIPKGVGPYPGFVAFQEKDAGVFFGRDREITEYLDALNLLKATDRAQALVISGGSGNGKSSLLKAGLIPRLRQQPDWFVVPPFDPSHEPIHALLSALRAAAQATGADIELTTRPPRTVEGLAELLQDNLRAIEEKANAWLLLPLDQAEVLLGGSQHLGGTDAYCLVTAIGQVLASRTRKLVAVLTIRTEFVPLLESTLPVDVRLQDQSLRAITALSEIIEKPAARFGIELEEGLTGRMVEDTRGADALPLLAYTLRELNEQHGDNRLLTVAEYELLGGVEGAIEKKLHEALSDPKPTAEELAAFRRCFVRQLVRVEENAVEGERYLRTAVARVALPDGARRLVDRLEKARLLIGADDGTIGLAHERLISNWPDVPMQAWLAEDRNDRKLIDNLKSFLSAHRDGGPLLSEKPLLDAKDLMERDRLLEDDEPELAQFVKDSVGAEQSRQRRQTRQLRTAVAAAIAFLLVAGGAVRFFLEARNQTHAAEQQTRMARANESRALAALSEVASNEHRYLDAVKLAVAAWPRTHDGDRPQLRATVKALGTAQLLQRLAIPPLRHEYTARGAAFNSDETRILTWSDDDTARLWDAATGNALLTPLRHEGPVSGAAFNGDETRILTWSDDNTARLWNAATGEALLPPLRHEDSVQYAAFNADGTGILTWSRDGTARLWDAATGSALLLLRHEPTISLDFTRPVGGATFNGDETRILTWSLDNTSRLWDVTTGQELLLLRHNGSVRGAAFNSDETRILTWSDDDTARLWDAVGGQELLILRHESGVEGAAFNGDETHILTWSDDDTARLWDAVGGQQQLILRHEGLFGATFNGDGSRILTWSNDDTVHLWDASTDNALLLLRHEPTTFGTVRGAAFNGDETRILTWSDDGTTRLWDAASGQLLLVLHHEGSVWGAAFNGDETRILTWSADGTTRLWDAVSGQALLLRHEGDMFDFVNGAEFNGDETRILTWSADGTTRLWDAASGQELLLLRHEGSVRGAAFNGDETRILTWSGDGTTRMWDAVSGQPLLQGRLGDVWGATFSSDGTRILTWTDDGTAWLLDAASGKGLLVLHHDLFATVRGAAFNGDETRILTWSEDATARLWDAVTGHTLLPPMRHDRLATVRGAAFNGDETRILTWSTDGTVRLWDAANGQELLLLRHEGGMFDTVNGAAFNGDETRILTWSQDGTVRLWDAASGQELLLLRHEGESINAVLGAAFNGDETRILTWAKDHTVRFWGVASGQELLLLRHEGSVRGAAFNGDETRILTWSQDGTARLWDVSRTPRGHLFEIACGLLPDRGTSELEDRYGVSIAEPICGPEMPAPVWAQLED